MTSRPPPVAASRPANPLLPPLAGLRFWIPMALAACHLLFPSAAARLSANPGTNLLEKPPTSLLSRPLDQLPLAQLPHPAVARIIAEEPGAESHGSGTLVDVREDYGLVITNWHVIRDATGAITVRFPNGFTSPARVRKVDKDWDLAALIIWRPTVDPVAISQQAPRRGDLLTIAGYGPGNYRAATGRCTQYVAPGVKFPPEMVELSAQARQGDSGGPIFNERGELAGVLFGAAQGTTTGSYCGRVRAFLSSVLPPPTHGTIEPRPDANNLAGSPHSTSGAVANSPPWPSSTATPPAADFPPPPTTNTTSPHPATVPLATIPSAPGASIPPAPTSSSREYGPNGHLTTIPDPTAPPPRPASEGNPAAFSNIPFEPPSQAPRTPPLVAGADETWESPTFPRRDPTSTPAPADTAPTLEQLLAIDGTPWEKAKTIFALIGVLSVAIQAGRLLGGSEQATG